MQHSLDDTLAMARLLVGYERTHTREQRLGAERAVIGLVTALFHDAGYIREMADTQHRNGAEFTRTHVTRGAQFLARYLPTIGLAAVGAGGDADHPLHRLRGAVRADPARRPA